MKFCLQMLAATAVLLGLYLAGLRLTGWHADYAEANVVANEIKWQRFERQRAADVVLVGSSIGGRLPAPRVAGPGRAGVNLCLDGSSPRLGIELLREEEVFPPVLVVEANTLSLLPSQNDQTLRANFRSFHNKLARHVPLLRAENRPVTLVFSQLKLRADRRRAGARPAPPLDDAVAARLISASKPALVPGAETAESRDWRERLRPFVERGCRVVLVMLPDGGQDRAKDYTLARQLTAAGIPLLDLKGAFPENEFRYTDGIHLVRPAAEAIADLLARVLPRLEQAGP